MVRHADILQTAVGPVVVVVGVPCRRCACGRDECKLEWKLRQVRGVMAMTKYRQHVIVGLMCSCHSN